jgi:peptide deformylase
LFVLTASFAHAYNLKQVRLLTEREIEMAKLSIVTPWDENSEVLRRTARRVRTFDGQLHQLLDNMVETMREAKGVGLAAPQIGVDQRITVIEYPEDEDRPDETMHRYELINPEIVKTKGSEVAQEGCLSLPGLAADVERATYVLVKAQDRYGKEVRFKAYDWLARIFQHEIDHLHGVLMTERAKQVYKMEENDEGEIELIPVEMVLPTAGD